MIYPARSEYAGLSNVAERASWLLRQGHISSFHVRLLGGACMLPAKLQRLPKESGTDENQGSKPQEGPTQ